MQIHNLDVLDHIKTVANNYFNFTFSDFPYFLGTKWHYVNGKLQMKGKGKDFMGKWNIQSADWWREYFSHLFRVTKYGGYVVFYSISQQSWAFSALMVEAGFEKCQELHWANIGNFPKSVDASKQIDKRLGQLKNRKVVGKIKQRANSDKSNTALNNSVSKEFEYITSPATKLAELFDGYKYGLAPLKKITEPILVFRKPCKFGSVLNDLMRCQSDTEISPAVLDIENNRVGIDINDDIYTKNPHTVRNPSGYNMNTFGKLGNDGFKYEVPNGRFPATLFISPEAAELLDSQLDLITFELNGKIYEGVKRLEYQRIVNWHVLNNTFESCKVWGVKREVIPSSARLNCLGKEYKESDATVNFRQKTKFESIHNDSGFISRVLHQPDFNEADYASLEYAMNELCQYNKGISDDTFFFATVSPSERNAGLPISEKKNKRKTGEAFSKDAHIFADSEDESNDHPTLKPIGLNKEVSALFRLPKEFNQKVYIPFSGSGSEIIGCLQAGFAAENITAVEINKEYYEISKSRIAFFSNNEVQFENEIKSESKQSQNFTQSKLF